MDDLIMFLDSPSGIGGLSLGAIFLIIIVVCLVLKQYKQDIATKNKREKKELRDRKSAQTKTAKKKIKATIVVDGEIEDKLD